MGNSRWDPKTIFYKEHEFYNVTSTFGLADMIYKLSSMYHSMFMNCYENKIVEISLSKLRFQHFRVNIYETLCPLILQIVIEHRLCLSITHSRAAGEGCFCCMLQRVSLMGSNILTDYLLREYSGITLQKDKFIYKMAIRRKETRCIASE